MKTKILLIGLGVISKNYYNGLKSSSNLDLVGVCDINPNAFAKEIYSEIPFFIDYKEAENVLKPDLAIICTPPKNHGEIIAYFLNKRINVLVEKPATVNIGELENLIALSREKEVFFDCIFHWQYGSEVLYLQKHFQDFGNLLSVTTTVFDPYTVTQDQIASGKLELCGVWLDSGVNILSMLSYFIPIESLRFIDKQISFDREYNLPTYANLSLYSNNIPVDIVINWNTTNEYKRSQFIYDKGVMDICHTEQSIFFNGKLIFEDNSYPRLYHHYRNYFLLGNLQKLEPKFESNMLSIHRALFDINTKLNTI